MIYRIAWLLFGLFALTIVLIAMQVAETGTVLFATVVWLVFTFIIWKVIKR